MLYTYGFLFVSDGDWEFDLMPKLNDLNRQLHNKKTTEERLLTQFILIVIWHSPKG